MTPLRITTERARDQLLEVRFSLDVDDRVPGLLVRPADPAGPTPLVVIQHPGTDSKDGPFVGGPARYWAREYGWTCIGLDAPLHGERDVVDPMRLFANRTRLAPDVLEQFAGEVSAAIDAVAAEHPVDLGRLGYVGYSLGAMLGLTAVARDGRFRAASFCLVGEGLMGRATGADSVVPLLDKVAVRLVGKERDEIVPRAATEALYEALPGEKDLVWLPGGHFSIGPDVIDAAADWLVGRLQPTGG
jgi:predicted esterase